MIIIVLLYIINLATAKANYQSNQFSHLTPDEFRDTYLRAQPDLNNRVNRVIIQPQSDDNTTELSLSLLPVSLDWRQHNVLNPIRDQRLCGSCWAFGLINSIESRIAISTGNLIQLSEQQFVDCDNLDFGCSGGNLEHAINYTQHTSGICSQDYIYVGTDEKCQNCQPVAKVTDYQLISGEADIIQALQNGTVAVYLDGSLLQYYSSNIIEDIDHCSDQYFDLNHVVNIVGYDIHNGVKYWIVRNSWGDIWGESGYFRIIRGINACGIELFGYSVNAIQIDSSPHNWHKYQLTLITLGIVLGVVM